MSSKGCAREKFTPRAYLYDSARLPKNTEATVRLLKCACSLKASPPSEELDFYFLLSTRGAVKPCRIDLPTAGLGPTGAAIPPTAG